MTAPGTTNPHVGDSVSVSPVVSIVVVTYGTGPIVLECLDAVARHTPLEHEVIVVDCLPPDPRMRTSLLLTDRSDIRLLVANDNLGFAGGNEWGVAHARGDHLCFLNPDVIVGPGWLEPLLVALDDPAVGIAAPVFVDDGGSLEEAGQVIFCDTFTAPIGGPGMMTGDRTNVFSRDVDYASAACWVVRRADHLALDGFDRRYHPAYFEDADYALRMEARGLRTRLVAAVPVVHRRGQGSGTRDAAVGQATHARFRRTWGDQLADRPARPCSDAEVIAARDRLAASRTVVVAWSEAAGSAERSAAFEQALDRARTHPRDRVTFLTDVAPDDGDAARARIGGLEVVVIPAAHEDRGDVEDPRVANVDEVVRIGSVPARRRRRSPWTWFAVGGVVVAGVVMRWLLLDSPAAAFNSDEAYAGIEAYEILRGRFPIVLGGTVYTLPFESYVYAPFVAVFGGQIVPLKLLSTLSWAGTAVTLYAIGRRMVGERAGFLAAALCWITPGALMVLSITAYPAYASGMLVVSLAFLVATIVVDIPDSALWKPALFGVLAGFAFWLHPMFLTTVVPMALVVLWAVRRRFPAVLAAIGGGIVGCLPLLAWNATNGWPSLDPPVEVPGTYGERLRTFAVDLLPRAFGLRDRSLEWYGSPWSPLLYLVLLATIAVGLWSIARNAARSRSVLLAVVGAVFFLMAFLSNLIYANDGRYAVISFPFLLIALAAGIDRLAGQRPPIRTVAVLVAASAIWIVGFVRPEAQPFLDARGVDPNAELDEIVDLLDERGIDRIYGSYWAVLPVEFVGDDRIVGAVFPFWPIRFPERQRTVGATDPRDVAVVYLRRDEDPAQLLLAPEQYERVEIGDRVLYLPLAASGAG